MRRVLLVIDDYGELLYLQTLLKKLGFDVDGIQSERGFEESFLSLNPDIVVATAKGVRVNGITLAENMRRVREHPKVVILAPSALAEKLTGLQIANVDRVIESPVSATQMLSTLAQFAEIDEAGLLEKYRKLKATLSPDREADLAILRREEELAARDQAAIEAAERRAQELVGDAITESPAPAATKEIQLAPSTLSEQERRERFKRGLQGMGKQASNHYPRERIVEFHREIRATENQAETAALEKERQDFVKALFKKAKGND